MSVRPYVRVRPDVRTYVRTSTIKLSAATNEIVVFVRVNESFAKITFKVIRGQGQGEEMTSVPYRDYFFVSWNWHVSHLK